jgi:hypothetical protein
MNLDEIIRFKDWVIENNCEQVAVESTGVSGFRYTWFWNKELK